MGVACASVSSFAVAQEITLFRLPANPADPSGIAAGPDGNLWFTEWRHHLVGRLATPPAPQPATVPPASGAAFVVLTVALAIAGVILTRRR